MHFDEKLETGNCNVAAAVSLEITRASIAGTVLLTVLSQHKNSTVFKMVGIKVFR